MGSTVAFGDRLPCRQYNIGDPDRSIEVSKRFKVRSDESHDGMLMSTVIPTGQRMVSIRPSVAIIGHAVLDKFQS